MTPGLLYSRRLALLPHRLHQQHPTERRRWETRASGTEGTGASGAELADVVLGGTEGAAYPVKLLGLFLRTKGNSHDMS